MFASTVLDNPFATSAFAPPEAQRDALRVPYFFSLADHPLEDILERPYSLFLELDGYDRLTSSIMRVLKDVPDFSLSLTTGSAYQGHIASLIAAQLNKRFGLQSYKSMNIHTCLQEALINAIVHGNLGIDGQFESLAGFDEHYAMVAKRLSEEQYRRRRVTVSAWNSRRELKLCISDEGGGFPDAPSLAPSHLPHGRGLMLIQSLASEVWVGEDRLSLYMTFGY